MAEEQVSYTITDDELQVFAAKLDAWGASLTPKEQTFLLGIVERAAVSADVHGYGEVARYNFYEAWPTKWALTLPSLQSIAAQRG